MKTPLISWQARVCGGRLVPTTIAPFRRGDIDCNKGVQDALAHRDQAQGVRARLFELQAAVGAELPPVECPLQHTFIDGVYLRTIFIEAGTVVVGKIHKHRHANILSQGEVSVMTEEGGLERLKGPLTMVSPAGCKRAVYAHTDTTWTTIHATSETDLDKIEDWVIAKTYQDYEQFVLEGEKAMQQIEVSP